MTHLDVNTCWELLGTSQVGRLAVWVNGGPEIFPVNHIVDHGTVVFRTAPGTKLAGVTMAGSLAFEVDGYDSGAGEAWSVVIKGRAEEITRDHERIEAASLPLFPWHAGSKTRIVRIVADEVSGRRFPIADRTFAGGPPPPSRRRTAQE